MNERIEVRNQAEFDKCIAEGNIAIVIDCRIVMRGNSSAEMRGNSSAVMRDNSSAVMRDNSSAEMRGNSSAVMWDNSSAVMLDNSSAVMRDNSSVTAYNNVFIRFFFAFKIKASAGVVIMNHKTGDVSCIDGGRVLDIVEDRETK